MDIKVASIDCFKSNETEPVGNTRHYYDEYSMFKLYPDYILNQLSIIAAYAAFNRILAYAPDAKIALINRFVQGESEPIIIDSKKIFAACRIKAYSEKKNEDIMITVKVIKKVGNNNKKPASEVTLTLA